ncbi:MAG: histidinol-phosphate transaminase [Acidimicrobiia bacterium]
MSAPGGAVAVQNVKLQPAARVTSPPGGGRLPTFRPDVSAISPYRPGRPVEEVARELGLDQIVKLASNECPYPPFPEVLAAITDAAGGLNRYPDNERFYLRHAVADQLGVPESHLWFGGGTTELLVATAQAVGGPGTSAVYAWPSFVMYRIATRLAGARAVEVPLDARHRHDLEAMGAALRDDSTVVYLCNPNNPTGTYVASDALVAFVNSVPARTLVVVDEAYFEFATAADFGSALPLALERPNVMVTRTFSKVYGLAGLRVGYAVTAPEIITELRKAQPPFSVNSLAQVAAMEALRHQDRVAERTRLNTDALKLFAEELTQRGLEFADSQTNFVYLRVGDDAAAVGDALLGRGVVVRPMSDGWARVTVGTEHENRLFFQALDSVLGG